VLFELRAVLLAVVCFCYARLHVLLKVNCYIEFRYEGSRFMREIYTTEQVICYVGRLLDSFSKLLSYKVKIPDKSFTYHEDSECSCWRWSLCLDSGG
jgi:hypothetical protein